ncbi:uncharacterized protein [Anabrus simplex]|uniref:uncharacterized protein n=1 Tax=Anabrus simplex TaxID=316456 RepID=UPI0035A339CE
MMTGILLAAVFLLALIQAGLACYMPPMPPKITFPTQRKIEVRPGATFTFKCQNVFRLRWMTPENNLDRTIVEEVNLIPDMVSIDLYESTFTRTSATPEDSGYYYCIQLGHDINEDTSDKVYVNVTGTPIDDTPGNIGEKPQQRVKLSYEFKEGNFEVTCRALLEDGTPYHMFWQGPSRLARKNGQIRLQRLPLETENGRRIAVHKLSVLDVNGKNDGLYTCTLLYNAEQEYSRSLSLSGHNVQLFEETSNELKQL